MSSTNVCADRNENSCKFYLSLGVKCDSVAYINNILFSDYCCNTCNLASTTTKATATTTSIDSCKDINNQACTFYLSIGIRCISNSYLYGIKFSDYCCGSCNQQSTTIQQITTTATTTLSVSCKNVNEAQCNYFIGVGIRCNSPSYIGTIPFSKYCCQSCLN